MTQVFTMFAGECDAWGSVVQLGHYELHQAGIAQPYVQKGDDEPQVQ
jgi:hypothetical protein